MSTKAQTFESRAAVRANVDVNSQFDVAYVTMNALATVVACYGLFANSPAVVIGAMIIAMLLGPISGVALGLVDRNNPLFWKALTTLAGGVAVVYGTALVLGLLQTEFPLTGEIYARTAPNLMDLMIALGVGAAGAYSMISPRLSVAFVGVAIATALVPPLASSAICLARGEFSLALGALLLALANIVAIQVASSAVMWLAGYRGTTPELRGTELRRNLLSVAVLGSLTARLSVNWRLMITNEVYKASVRKLLNTLADTHKGAYLTDVRYQRDSGRMVVVAVYRTPVPFTPTDVAAIEPRLPPMPGTGSPELRIRSVPVTVSSEAGYLFSSEDVPEYNQPM